MLGHRGSAVRRSEVVRSLFRRVLSFFLYIILSVLIPKHPCFVFLSFIYQQRAIYLSAKRHCRLYPSLIHIGHVKLPSSSLHPALHLLCRGWTRENAPSLEHDSSYFGARFVIRHTSYITIRHLLLVINTLNSFLRRRRRRLLLLSWTASWSSA